MLDLLIENGLVVDGTGAPPRLAHVAVQDGRIVAVGPDTAPARHVIDARNMIVTPGFVDIHTHYDGQAMWDTQLDPSFSSGITTAILGNCGVGFAPVHEGGREHLIELMEGVEEIPGTALHAGLSWDWSGFDTYFSALEKKPHSFDLGVLLPHGPLRLYVMGDKVGTDKCANGDELRQMAALVDEALAAGAFGLSSSRTPVHRTSSGAMTPDFDVDEAELTALARSVAAHGGYLQLAPNGVIGEDFAGAQKEIALYDRIIRNTGVTVHFSVLQTNQYPDFVFEQIAWAERVNSSGIGRVFGQIGGRGLGTLLSFHGTHPFMDRPTAQALAALPREERLARYAQEDTRRQVLAEPTIQGGFPAFMIENLAHCFDLGPEMDYEPDASRTLALRAEQQGRPLLDLVYELMLQTSDQPRLLLPFVNYAHGDFNDLHRIMQSPAAVLGLSDAGAHVMTVCDGAVYPFILAHWVRDRSRGPKLPLEQAIRMMTMDTALSVGLRDRGVLAPGYKADINILDLDRLHCTRPQVFYDLPDGSPRLMQLARGFRATIVSGIVTRENDAATGELPGRVLRHRAAAPAPTH